MNGTIHELVHNAALKNPDEIAVRYSTEEISYRELNERSDDLAARLFADGIEQGHRVGILLEKSIAMVVAVYGVLKTGAAFVPLDPHAPPARAAHIIEDCSLTTILTSGELLSVLERGDHNRMITAALLEGTPPATTRIETVDMRSIGSDGSVPKGEVDEDRLAYVLYTSGSTGRPKGVMLTHRNCMTFIDWAVEHFQIGPGDRLTNIAPLHFDLSTFDLFAAAAGSATVLPVPPSTTLFPKELGNFLREEEASIIYAVPSALTMLALRGGLEREPLQALRLVLFAGEVFPPKHLKRLMQLVPQARFFNLYGPTETNVCTFHEVDRDSEPGVDPVPIGRPIDGVTVRVIADDGRESQPGEIGELHVTGPCVMKGYWGEPSSTPEVLVSDPQRDGQRTTYKTGDMVFSEPEGVLRFVGRRDSQIKTRGYRVELGEVESVIASIPQVLEVAVVPIPDELITTRLRAHVVTGTDLKPAELVRLCSGRLPRYMIPDDIRFVDSLPRTPTGKVDRQSLITGEDS